MLIGKRRERVAEIPTSSMADIAFLLLVFFLLTTTIDAEKGLDIALPEDKSEEIRIPKKNLANLLINAAGQVLLDGQAIEIRDITQVVKEKLLDNPLLIVSIKTDRLTKYDVYINVLDRLKKADARKISIAEPEQN